MIFLGDLKIIPDPNTINSQGLGAVDGLLTNAINILIIAAGALSVIFLIIGGLRYTLAAGNPSAVEGAKKTITYAIIGLALTLLSVFIVNFATGLIK